MTFEEYWARTWKPTGQPAAFDAALREIALLAWNAGIESAAATLDKDDQAILSMAGEMSAVELQTTKAVLSGCRKGVRGLIQS